MGRSEFDKLIEELELTPFVFFIIRRIYRGDKSVQNVITKCRIMRRISFENYRITQTFLSIASYCIHVQWSWALNQIVKIDEMHRTRRKLTTRVCTCSFNLLG